MKPLRLSKHTVDRLRGHDTVDIDGMVERGEIEIVPMLPPHRPPVEQPFAYAMLKLVLFCVVFWTFIGVGLWLSQGVLP